MARVLAALSGGVDSAVAAWLLHRDGVAVEGAYMKNWIDEAGVFGDCPWEEDIADARAAAQAIGIPFRVLNFMRDYKDRVVRYLVDGYAHGLTPNPDVMCNREIKFGVLMEWAREHGFEAVATGHYARRAAGTGDRWELWEGVDKGKDQSYFLSLLRPAQLAAARFPVGHLTKPEVRALARQAGLPNADKKDSQGICFIGRVRINDFLAKYIPDQPGEVVDGGGRVIGRHLGLHRYTLGQRKGIGIPSNTDFEHYVVVGKETATNRLVVDFDRPATPGLFQTRLRLHGLSWLIEPPDRPHRWLARPRYRDPAWPVHFEPLGRETAEIAFETPQRAIAPGQVCALYDGEQCLGAGLSGVEMSFSQSSRLTQSEVTDHKILSSQQLPFQPIA